MQTLTELNRADQEVRQRAARYETLVNKRNALRDRLKGLAAISFDAEPLEIILAQVERVNPTLVTHAGQGLGAVSGGAQVRYVLGQVATAAMADLRERAKQHSDRIAATKEDLANIVQAMADEGFKD